MEIVKPFTDTVPIIGSMAYPPLEGINLACWVSIPVPDNKMAQPRLPIMLATVGDRGYFRPLTSVSAALTNGALELASKGPLQEAHTVSPDKFRVEPQEGHGFAVII